MNINILSLVSERRQAPGHIYFNFVFKCISNNKILEGIDLNFIIDFTLYTSMYLLNFLKEAYILSISSKNS